MIMKKIILGMMFMSFCCTANAAVKASSDTTFINVDKVQQVIVDETTNSKGKPTKKYYLVINNELVSTNKTTVERIELSRKHKLNIRIAIITGGSTRAKCV